MSDRALVRCFFCVELPREVKLYLSSLAERYFSDRSLFKAVERENLHVTVRFVGEVEPSTVEALSSEVGRRLGLSALRPFGLRLGSPGSFGRPPRVFWVGLEGDLEGLLGLWRLVEGSCEALGLRGDGKPFSPHVTLARVRGSAPGRLRAISERFEGELVEGMSFEVSSLVLMESALSREGPTYRPITSWRLGV